MPQFEVGQIVWVTGDSVAGMKNIVATVIDVTGPLIGLYRVSDGTDAEYLFDDEFIDYERSLG